MNLRRQKHDYDLIVIGSGAGGSVAAHYVHSLGKRVAVIEKAEVGGECPNWACVPTKALLRSAKIYQQVKNGDIFGVETKGVKLNWEKAKKWKDLVVSRTGASHGEEIFEKEGLDLIRGKAEFVSPHEIEVKDKIYSAHTILIATGTVTAIPPISGLEKNGYITFREVGDLKELPNSIFIIGGGAVGCEFAQIFSSFDKKVIIADELDKLLYREEKEVSDITEALFENAGIEVLTGIRVMKIEKKNKSKIITYEKDGRNHKSEAEEILVATGKKPVLDIALEKAGVKVENNRIVINSYLQTSVKHIYAAGDLIGPYMFTHTGEYQSYLAGQNAFGRQKIKADYSVVPRCVFIEPEIASVGLGEEEVKHQKIKYKVGITALAQVGRANTSNEFDGFVKIITDKKHKIIGASIVAPRAGEMIHELALAIKLKATAEDVAELIHAYPTFSEAIKFACSNLEEK